MEDKGGINGKVKLSSPSTAIMPVVAVRGGYYVDESGGYPIIKHAASWRADGAGIVSRGGTPFVSELVHFRTRYVGTVYPDGSSLPYIPVKGFIGRKRETETEEWETKFYVPSEVYEKMCLEAKQAYLRMEPTHTIEVSTRTHTVKGQSVIPVELGNRVYTVVGGRRCSKTIGSALPLVNPIVGEGLVVIKLRKAWFKDVVKMWTELYSMMIREKVDAIFGGPFQWEEVDFDKEVSCDGNSGEQCDGK